MAFYYLLVGYRQTPSKGTLQKLYHLVVELPQMPFVKPGVSDIVSIGKQIRDLHRHQLL